MSGRILWINAGGTIVSKPYADPRHAPIDVEPMPLGDSEPYIYSIFKKLGASGRMDGLSLLGCHPPYDPSQFGKDSKKFTDDDISALADIIQQSTQKYILINHGTDWMAHNARRLQARLELMGVDKTVMIVGAMVPLSMQQEFGSDGPDNIAYALKHIDTITAGVYIVGCTVDGADIRHFAPVQHDKAEKISKKDLKLTFGERVKDEQHRTLQ